MFQIVIQIGEELDGMVVIRNGDNRQGVCPSKFLQEVWRRHHLEKIKFEGRTFYPPRQSSSSQFNSTPLDNVRGQFSDNNRNKIEQRLNNGQTKADFLMNKMYCQAECHSNVNSTATQVLGRNKLVSYPQAKCDQINTAPDVVKSSMSSDILYNIDLYNEKEGNRENMNIFTMNDPTTPDVLWFIENTVDVDNQKIIRRRSLAQNLIPISSSTRPLGLPSSCSPSQYRRRFSRFRYRNIKNITSLSRPLLIGWDIFL